MAGSRTSLQKQHVQQRRVSYLLCQWSFKEAISHLEHTEATVLPALLAKEVKTTL